MKNQRRVPTATSKKKDGRGGNPLTRRPPPRTVTITKPSQHKTDPDALQARKDAYLRAYEVSMANVTLACKHSDTSKSSVYNWRRDDVRFKEEMDALLDVRIDFYENALDKNARAGNVSAQIFFLKCRAKHRGYVERTEVTGADGGPVALTREEVPDAALRAAVSRMVQDDPDFAKRLLQGS